MFRFLMVWLFLFGLSVGSYADEGDTPYISWQPPIGVPIVFTADKDGIDVSFSKKYVTPFGIIDVGYNEHTIDFQEEYTYIIFKYTNIDKEEIFKINSQKRFKITNFNHVTKIEVDGRNRNQIKFFVKKGDSFNLSLEIIEDDLGKWIKPSNRICKNYGGKIYYRNLFGIRIDDYDACKATWSDAKKICRASGGILPSKDTLKEAILNCGGIWINRANLDFTNIFDSSFESCLKEKGFDENEYWSSINKNSSQAWAIAMKVGYATGATKELRSTSVMCEKKE